eukprot:COSAG02_NODE_28620_length_586_cov_0.798768_2_plen_121_part_01
MRRAASCKRASWSAADVVDASAVSAPMGAVVVTAAGIKVEEAETEALEEYTEEDASSTEDEGGSTGGGLEPNPGGSDALVHRQLTRDHLVAMAQVVGLDGELLDSMVAALDGDLQRTSSML